MNSHKSQTGIRDLGLSLFFNGRVEMVSKGNLPHFSIFCIRCPGLSSLFPVFMAFHGHAAHGICCGDASTLDTMGLRL